MKCVLYMVCIVCLTSTLTAQQGWYAQNPLPTTHTLHAVASFNNHAIAVGADGAIVRTSNSGNDWEAVESGTSKMLTDVAWGVSLQDHHRDANHRPQDTD